MHAIDGIDIEQKTDGATSSLLVEEMQTISEIERFQQINAEFNSIEGIDDLFIHYGRSDSQLLDEMVAEFGMECPGFDIFNYVDPVLNAALDDDRADALNAIDCDIQQSEINLNSLNDNCEQLAALKCHLKHQQEVISHLVNLVVFQPTNSEISLVEGEHFQHQAHVEKASAADANVRTTFDIDIVASGNAATNETSPLSDVGRVGEVGRIEKLEPDSKHHHDGSNLITQSEDDVRPPPSSLHPKYNVNQSDDSLRIRKVRIVWKGKANRKTFSCHLMDDEEIF